MPCRRSNRLYVPANSRSPALFALPTVLMRTAMAEVSVLNALLYGEPVATLTRVSGDRTLFAFNEAYIADRDRPTLSLAFKDSLGELITDFRPTQTRLLPYFANLLPEGRMRAYL